MAVGLVSFVLISMMGLNSTGLLVLQAAGFDQVSSGIGSVLAAEYRVNPPGALQAEPRYFDVEGREVSAVADAIYRADISLAPARVNGAEIIPPASLQALKMEVRRVAGEQRRTWVILLSDSSRTNAP